MTDEGAEPAQVFAALNEPHSPLDHRRQFIGAGFFTPPCGLRVEGLNVDQRLPHGAFLSLKRFYGP